MGRYKVPRTVTRPLTRWKCTWDPQRTEVRRFTASDAARIMCYAVRQGATRSEIEAKFKLVCSETKDRPRNAAEEAMSIAAEALLDSNNALLDSYRAFLVINGILVALIALRFLGPVRFISLIATPTRTLVAALIRVNIRQRAANEAAYNGLIKQIAEFRRAA